MNKITIKSDEELNLMEEGGKKLSQVKHLLEKEVKAGVSAYEIDKLAEKLIEECEGKPSFKMVPGYSWTTCININEGVVHGIPSEDIVFKDGDLVSIDLGMFYKGFHTDTSISLAINPNKEVEEFLKVGKKSLQKAISSVVPNKSYIYDISEQIEKSVTLGGYSVVKDLTGHGIGKNLHENPYIPCFVSGLRIETPKIVPGMALAIEVMYTLGSHKLVKESNGWTISTADGKIAGLFEDTVIVTQKGYKVIT
ncbi:type I methionyl aminopeptidase [Candidatus Woesebacteria bacterium RIFOXYC1_FULL_31_51]|nr:MAG: methionine aminopeptidase, type I [Candidatus Woesebacteria bacterium GW2011_GWF1_31_35]KKP23334.1 MAG: Methionine aminopeptidase [Candidatus Woesebacteria bacterium GW2011_GWC1_30_29]KKP26148.1 MAG: Methionine aminopeptidase [Candidatus Woesebacteria bacterium GW2011_GWD1_31_12]KKP27595.1 MAG: Methionine aminopeptidase [Candidatus Woesebacteria bacterium GW2011_GWB1_31_29]KKP31030.1 MAG: Methionine aminopeptidase [Candidatus Woesebacteria bacterium GW2011_GWE2_31_6]KKP34348.1 MAG: Met